MSRRLEPWGRFFLSVAVALPGSIMLFASGCSTSGSGSTGPQGTNTVAAHAGTNQSGTVGQPVAVPPAVRVTRGGAGVAGVAGTFTVAPGHGTVTGASATTDGNGVAAVGSWTLGTAAGPQSLTAAVSGATGSPVTFSATAVAGPPQTVAKQAGDNQQFRASNPVPVRPSVRVTDQFGNPVPGVTVQFAVTAGSGSVPGAQQTTDAAGVATVGQWILGPELGEQRLAATVLGFPAADPAVFTAEALENAIAPAADTVLTGGVLELTRFTVGAGRTVTVTGTLLIRAENLIEVAGTLRGTCVTLTLDAGVTLTVAGVVDNSCADDADDPPALLLIGRDTYEVTDDAEIITSGDFEITNDPALTDADFPPALGPQDFQALRTVRARAAPAVATSTTDRCRIGGTLRARPEKARDGRPGIPRGDDGLDGRRLWVTCRGNAIVSRMEVFGQNGGHGGKGTHTLATNNHARGGNGGAGGEVRFRSTGGMTFLGNSTIRTGRGGDGGPAEGRPVQLPGPRAPDGNATGGTGGRPGLFQVLTQGPITFPGPAQAPAVFTIGDAGDGGLAEAKGANGLPAHPAGDAQPGGHADATGGMGGSTQDLRLSGAGIVNPGGLLVNGGNGGRGGIGDATGGTGGAGTRPRIHGARGGDITANGGRGGNTNLRDQFGAPIGSPGPGGGRNYRGGKGGPGDDGCVPRISPGGNGGRGGNTSGDRGQDGVQGGNPSAPALARMSPIAQAVDPGVIEEGTGNGGNAGPGWPAGDRGGAGTNGTPDASLQGPAFQEGNRNNFCPFTVTFAVRSDPGGLEPGLGFTGPAASHAAVFLQSGTSFFGSIGLGTTNTVCLVRQVESPFSDLSCGSLFFSAIVPSGGMSFTGGGSFSKSTSSGSASGSFSVSGTIDPVQGLIQAILIMAVILSGEEPTLLELQMFAELFGPG
jgi:hypothetical protein